MARRKHVEEPINHERWLVSYADFITLLFAFFVVMYSMSSVNEDKYRVLSDAMISAFSDPKTALQAAQESGLARISPLSQDELNTLSGSPTALIPLEKGDQALPDTGSEDGFSQRVLDEAEVEIDGIADGVEEKMEDLIDEGIINLKRNKFWLEIEIKSSLLFLSGSSQLIVDSIPVLVELSGLFVDLPNRVNVEGFTDNRPIQSRIFPSNWELSSARAAAVVRLFERSGVDPSRMASIGYGEHQPISDNADNAARAQNRRVVVVVMASLNGQTGDRIYEFELLKEQAGG
ncbi:MAG: flagellar motor protein MotD [Halioglobus sp.]